MEIQCPHCQQPVEVNATVARCEHCQQDITLEARCPDCHQPLQVLKSCGAVDYFCQN